MDAYISRYRVKQTNTVKTNCCTNIEKGEYLQ